MSREERRRRILDAARAVYAEEGDMSAGLRPIAARAGVTTGAIYAVFAGKEEIYAALLQDSLSALAQTVGAAARGAESPGEAAAAAILAFYDFYEARQFDYALGLYQFERDGRVSLGPEVDAALNAELDRSMDVIRAGLAAHGEEEPDLAAALLFSVGAGALAMRFARRDRTMRVESRALVEAAVARLIR